MTLADYITEKLSIPFGYGTHDCILFTIGWVEIATGNKYLPNKIWKDEKEALRLIKKVGGLTKVFDEQFARINPNYAKDGDLTLVDGIAFLFSGPRIISVSKNGLTYKSRSEAKQAWSHNG